MGIIIGIIVLVLIGFALAIPLAVLVVRSRSQAKVKAKRILESGQITNSKEFDRISKILSTIPNDLEAADLWRKLQELRKGRN